MTQAAPHGWAQETTLTRTICRADFIEALALVIEIGKLAEAANHHPDIDVRYATVTLSLCTHSAGHQITSKDFALAGEINGLEEKAILATSQELRRRFKS